VERLATAIQEAASDKGVRSRVAALSKKIRAEDGTARAVDILHRHLHIAE